MARRARGQSGLSGRLPAVCLLDTSVWCVVLQVPGHEHRAADVLSELKQRVGRDETLLLPTTVILETGNLIARVPDGTLRRSTAERFVTEARKALQGESPFIVTPPLEVRDLLAWLPEFVEWVTKAGSPSKPAGFGDLTIHREWERQGRQHPSRRVYIWSLDSHLSSYDRSP
jgi:hypothetical protein